MADYIREMRDKTGLSQSRFAKQYGIPVSTLRKWEQGESSPPDYVVRLLAMALPQESQSVERISGENGSVFYYNPVKKSVMDPDGNEILIQENLHEIKPKNLIIYLEDLFESFYEARDRFKRDCCYDRKENIIWTR